VTSCAEQQLNLVLTQPLAQGMIAKVPLSRMAVPEVHNIPARHLQLMRSVPSQSIVSSIVGMKRPEHVRSNLEVVKKAPMSRTDFFEGIKPILRSEFIEDVIEM